MDSSATDPAHAYALAVVSGEEVAGVHVRAAARRHLRDLEAGAFAWDAAAADRAHQFFEQHLRLSGGQWTGRRLVLLPWQAFVVRSVFGWRRADGRRRLRKVYLETAKGSGKSPLAAGVALYMTVADGEAMGQGFLLAATKAQASIVFDYAASMVERDPTLARLLYKVGGDVHPYRLISRRDGTFLARVAGSAGGNPGGRSGFAPHYVGVDELHEHKSREPLDAYEMGAKYRREPLTFITTNAGAGIGTPCHQEHVRALDVVHGRQEADDYLALVYTVDDEDDPIADSGCWPKANPSLAHGGPPGSEYIVREVESARGMPSKQAIVLRWIFSRWTDAENPWIDIEAYDGAQADAIAPEEELAPVPCVVSLDLSRRADLTAAVLAWDHGDRVDVRAVAWTPAESLHQRAQRDAQPYPEWVERGWLRTVPDRVIHYSYVAEWLRGVLDRYRVLACPYDAHNVASLRWELDNAGIDAGDQEGAQLWMIPHPQGFGSGKLAWDEHPISMPKSIEAAEAMILGGTLRIERNALLRSAVLGAVTIADGSGNRKLSKTKSLVRIDAAVALVQALGAIAAFRRRDGGRIDPEQSVVGSLLG